MSWNVHEGAGDVERLLTSIGGAPAILLLQEALRSGDEVPAGAPASVAVPRREAGHRAALADVDEVARRLGLWAVYVPSMRNGQVREDRGCAILSTLPLTEPAAIELPWVHQRRVAVAATVSGFEGGRPFAIRVVSAHLDNRPGRRRQSEALAEWLQNQSRDGVPLVVGADLNTWFGSDEETVRQIHRVVPIVSECGEGSTFRFGRRLDYLFATPITTASRRCEIASQSLGSDHRPLVLHLSWP